MGYVGENGKKPLENMAEGQKRKDLVFVLHPVFEPRRQSPIHVTFLGGQHGPFGRTGRAGCIDKDGQVFRDRSVDTLLKKIRIFLEPLSPSSIILHRS